MKRNAGGVGMFLCFVCMLLFPKEVFTGAGKGLLLWFDIILPTLFPFLIVEHLLAVTGSFRFISDITGPVLSRIFKVSRNGSFAVVTGFLCGYPMGAKVTADLVREQRIRKEEGQYLLSFCNNVSPAFIINYLIWNTLGDASLLVPTLVILILAPFSVSLITRRIYLRKIQLFSVSPTELREKKWDFSLIDEGIMSSFEILVKVGGYVMLFSVLISLLEIFFQDSSLLLWILPVLEITNGITWLGEAGLPLGILYPALLAATSFGGWCAAAQTQCMLEKTGLQIVPYLIQKLAAALAASFFAVLYLLYFV